MVMMAGTDTVLAVSFAGVFLSVFFILYSMSHVGVYWALLGAAFSTLGVSLVRRYGGVIE